MPEAALHMDDPLDDFTRREITLDEKSKAVYIAGNGPAVIVMAEMPGISPYEGAAHAMFVALSWAGSGLRSSVRTAFCCRWIKEDNLLGMEDSRSESQNEGVTPSLPLTPSPPSPPFDERAVEVARLEAVQGTYGMRPFR